MPRPRGVVAGSILVEEGTENTSLRARGVARVMEDREEGSREAVEGVARAEEVFDRRIGVG